MKYESAFLVLSANLVHVRIQQVERRERLVAERSQRVRGGDAVQLRGSSAAADVRADVNQRESSATEALAQVAESRVAARQVVRELAVAERAVQLRND